jgi:uncharacterized RDD family membrane protein YckC
MSSSKESTINTGTDATPVALPTRLAAILYDMILLFSLLFAVTLFLILPLTHGNAITGNNIFYQLLLLLLMYIYFTWQWCHGGQTLGMRAWKIRLVGPGGRPVTKKQAGLRCVSAWVFCGQCFHVRKPHGMIASVTRAW